MAKLSWDDAGSHTFETGVDHGVLYVKDDTDSTKPYPKGVVWNGLSTVTESPSGAEASAIYADNMKYLNLYSTEEFAATVEAYTYPDEFAECDGSADLVSGVSIGQQPRKTFGMCYRTKVGTDANEEDHYKIHIIYGAKAAPSEKAYASVNDSPEAITFSWELSTTPVTVTDNKPTASVVIDTKAIGATKLAKLEEALYGTAEAEPYLPLPDDLKTLLSDTQAAG